MNFNLFNILSEKNVREIFFHSYTQGCLLLPSLRRKERRYFKQGFGKAKSPLDSNKKTIFQMCENRTKF